MNFCIRLIPVDGKTAWFNDEKFEENPDTGRITVRNFCSQQYLMDGWDIYGKPAIYSDWLRGTKIPQKYLKQAVKDARQLMWWNDGEHKVEIWGWIRGDWRLVKFDRTYTKMTIIGSYKKNMHADYDED